MNEDQTFLTPMEVAIYLRVDIQTVYRIFRTKEIRASKIGRQWRVRLTDLDDAMEEYEKQGKS